MSDPNNTAKYDDLLTSILVNENSILGFFSTIFNFLARRTDFYYVPEGPYENMGFPPGVGEELVIKVLRTCDPKNWRTPNGTLKPTDINNEIMCSTVAQEVEVVTEEDESIEEVSEALCQSSIESTEPEMTTIEIESNQTENINVEITEGKANTVKEPNETMKSFISDDYTPPTIPVQKNSEAYNGAVREKYSWSQTILELDVTIRLPPDIKSSKDVKVTINPGDICVACHNGDVLIKDLLPYKIKTMDSFWSISEGKLLIHLEKVQERWWNRLLDGEESINLSKIDSSRPMHELPEDHIAKIRELQWNQEQKMKGLPTSDEIRNMEILKKAWNVEGSPFKGKEFNIDIFRH